MSPSSASRILSRPSPWLTAAILLTIAAIAVLVSGGKPASAGNELSSFDLPPLIETRQVNLCKYWEDNNDGTLEPAHTFTFKVERPASGLTAFEVTRTVSESNTICGTFVTTAETLKITELPAPTFKHKFGGFSPSYKLANDNGELGGVGAIAYMGMDANKLTFKNVAAAIEAPNPQEHQLEICKHIEDNGDNVADDGVFRFDIGMQGGAVLVNNYSHYAAEGETVCSSFTLEDYGINPAGTIVVIEDAAELPLGWVHAAGYPRNAVFGGLLQVGSTATLTYAPGETIKTVGFINKKAVSNQPTPTATPSPANTPAPTQTPTPSNTPHVPPGPSSTPNPTGTPTTTPTATVTTPPATATATATASTPTATVTASNPGQGGGSGTAPTATPVGSSPTATQPAADGTVSSDPIVTQPTPIAPSTGNVASAEGHAARLPMVLFGLAALAASIGIGTATRKAANASR